MLDTQWEWSWWSLKAVGRLGVSNYYRQSTVTTRFMVTQHRNIVIQKYSNKRDSFTPVLNIHSFVDSYTSY